MARVAGFVPSEAKGKRNAVKRYIISNCPYYSKNERTSKTEAKKKGIAYLQFRFFATYGEVRVWLG